MIFMRKKFYTKRNEEKRGFTFRDFANKQKVGGFTLIEILIVVAIISILASIVLVGIGPTEQLGRDARRVSDLHQVQTALELYYAKCGNYPGGPVAGGVCPGYASAGGYDGLVTSITGSAIGVNAMPNDPQKSKKYYYITTNTGSSYVLGTTLENINGSVFSGYTAPSLAGYTDGTVLNSTCASPNFCLTL